LHENKIYEVFILVLKHYFMRANQYQNVFFLPYRLDINVNALAFDNCRFNGIQNDCSIKIINYHWHIISKVIIT